MKIIKILILILILFSAKQTFATEISDIQFLCNNAIADCRFNEGLGTNVYNATSSRFEAFASTSPNIYRSIQYPRLFLVWGFPHRPASWNLILSNASTSLACGGTGCYGGIYDASASSQSTNLGVLPSLSWTAFNASTSVGQYYFTSDEPVSEIEIITISQNENPITISGTYTNQDTYTNLIFVAKKDTLSSTTSIPVAFQNGSFSFSTPIFVNTNGTWSIKSYLYDSNSNTYLSGNTKTSILSSTTIANFQDYQWYSPYVASSSSDTGSFLSLLNLPQTLCSKKGINYVCGFFYYQDQLFSSATTSIATTSIPLSFGTQLNILTPNLGNTFGVNWNLFRTFIGIMLWAFFILHVIRRIMSKIH